MRIHQPYLMSSVEICSDEYSASLGLWDQELDMDQMADQIFIRWNFFSDMILSPDSPGEYRKNRFPSILLLTDDDLFPTEPVQC